VPTYVVDPTRFHAEGAIVAWATAAQRLGIGMSPRRLPASLFARRQRALPSVVELRWMLSADMGVPTEPFGVWARPHTAQALAQPLTVTQRQLLFAGGLDLITWADGSMSTVSVDVQAPQGGSIYAFSGGPLVANFCAFASIPTGNMTVDLSAHVIDGLLISPGVSVNAVRGVNTADLANAAGWTLIELVGLPVTGPAWTGIGKQGEPQGLVGAYTDAPTAAVARLTRGAPPIGWGSSIVSGIPAPAWVAPDFPGLIQEVNTGLLEQLWFVMGGYPPDKQAAQVVTVTLPPPHNSSGQHMSGSNSTVQASPLTMLLMAAATDPFLNLALGFGTAYDDGEAHLAKTSMVAQGARDFMVTAHWEHGLDGTSAPLDYAAIIPAPGSALPPPPPANMICEVLGTLAPLTTDGNWRASVRASWDRPPDLQLFRTVSFAAARAGIMPAQPAVALMDTRTSGGYRPLAINQAANPPDPDYGRLHVIDHELEIPSNPGTRQVKYGAAVQDIFGQWTPWAAVDESLVQPDLTPVQIVSAALTPTVPASGSVCQTELCIEFLWDWRIRTPQQVTLVGRLYAATTHGAPPPSMTVPVGLDRSLAGGDPALVVTFVGDTPTAPGATIIPLTEAGDNIASSFGSAQGSDTRRFRITLPGLALDFATTGFIGMALWAQGQERTAPQRVSAWSSNPTVIATADPRPPLMQVVQVKLGSIPDASGSSHVRISWASQQNAAGYFIYEATEASILDANSLAEPALTDTLDQRLLTVMNAYGSNPTRRPFTRLNATLLQSTSTDIALPRGSTGIHLYVVLGVSAGQVESEWPSDPKALIAVAAPHIMHPAAPMIEVQRVLDQTVSPAQYRANILITTRPGPRPTKVELHRVRVDDAAKELDTMGPPVYRLSATGGGWTVTTTNDLTYGPHITTVQGIDTPGPGGSWKRVWYRATAWTSEDDTRGGLPGRSAASTAAWVVLPPPDGPSVSPLLLGGGNQPADVLLQWTCASPVAKTPLGPHQIAVRANVIGAPANAQPLLAVDSTLDQLDSAPPATGSGVWIVNTALGVTTYRALLRRASVSDAVDFVVRITDPLGRSGAQLTSIPSGPADSPPDLENLTIQRMILPPPGHSTLTFTSTSPIQAPLDGPYVVKVTTTPHPPFPPPLPLEMPLGSVPTVAPSGIPPVMYMVRSGAGPLYTYEVQVRLNVTNFVVRLTAPDGQFIQKTVS
jgi:hypothetical protein